EPKDQLSARFAAALGAAPPEPPKVPAQLAQAGGTGSQTAQGGESGTGQNAPPPAPPQSLHGQWSAKPNEKISIGLDLKSDGTFAWTVTQAGKSQTIRGQAGYQDQILTLAQEQGPPLVGKVTADAAGNRFTFKPPATPESASGLSFEKARAAAAGS